MFIKQGYTLTEVFLLVCVATCLLDVNGPFAAGYPFPISDTGLNEQTHNAKGVKCFTCNDMERCPNLNTIFDQDKSVFKSDGTPLPPCAARPEPTSNKCIACRYQEKTYIYCPSNISSLEAEDDHSFDLGQIHNITQGCDPLPISDPRLNEQTNNDGEPLPISDSGLNEQTNNGVGSSRCLNGIGVLGIPVVWGIGLVGYCVWKKRGFLSSPLW